MMENEAADKETIRVSDWNCLPPENEAAEEFKPTIRVSDWNCLPPELQIDIFTRLSVPDLDRCKLLNKSYLKLISTAHFKQSLLIRHANILKSSNSISVVVGQSTISSTQVSSLKYTYQAYEVNHDGYATLLRSHPLDPHSFLPDNDSNIELRSSCNGLVLFSVSKNSFFETETRVFVYNPLTRVSTMLPSLPLFQGSYYSVDYPVWAFCCLDDPDRTSESYKVFIIRQVQRSSKVREDYLLVCTLGLSDSSWKVVQIRSKYDAVGYGSVENNILYWLGELSSSDEKTILSLDLNKDDNRVKPELILSIGINQSQDLSEMCPFIEGCEFLAETRSICVHTLLSVVEEQHLPVTSIYPIAVMDNGNKLVLLLRINSSVEDMVVYYDLQAEQVKIIHGLLLPEDAEEYSIGV